MLLNFEEAFNVIARRVSEGAVSAAKSGFENVFQLLPFSTPRRLPERTSLRSRAARISLILFDAAITSTRQRLRQPRFRRVHAPPDEIPVERVQQFQISPAS